MADDTTPDETPETTDPEETAEATPEDDTPVEAAGDDAPADDVDGMSDDEMAAAMMSEGGADAADDAADSTADADDGAELDGMSDDEMAAAMMSEGAATDDATGLVEEEGMTDADKAMLADALGEGGDSGEIAATELAPASPSAAEIAARSAQPVSFAPIAEAGQQDPQSINFLFDIPVQISVRLGETRILIRDLLQLGQGSVVELDKLAGEPLEVVVNSKLMARGEVVVVNEKFGVRLTEVVTPSERIHNLR